MKLRSCLLIAAIAAAGAPSARAAILYAMAGSNYTQNFDSLPNSPENTNLQAATPAKKWIDDTASPAAGDFSISGWYLYHPVVQSSEGGTNTHQRVRIGAGTANTGAFMSWGSSTATERALGMLSSNTMAVGPTGTPPDNFESYYGARLTNQTGATLTNFTISYTGEQWREGGHSVSGSVSAQQFVTFDYKVTTGAANIQDTGFTDVPALDFAGPKFGVSAASALDGNAAANRTAIGPVTISGLNWAPGDDLWIRWTDLNDTNNDHGLGIDDLKFSANVPEPGSLALLAIGVLAASTRRRR